MRTTHLFIAITLCLLGSSLQCANAQGSRFIYQGRLDTPTGLYDF